jgi:hypothetical protein
MAHFSNWAVTATIMLLMAAQSCHCEKNVHEKGKKIQTPGLWSALGCMITDDDITKCVRDHTVDTTGMHINDFPLCHIISAVDFPFLSSSYNFKTYSYTGDILSILLSRLSKPAFCTHKCVN